MDLLAAIALTALIVPLALLTTGPVRLVLGLLFLLFVPGYVLIAALFPKKDSLDTIERVVLSFALSIAMVPLAGVILNYTPWGITSGSVVTTTAVFIVVGSAAVLYRRYSLPREDRFVVLRPAGQPSIGRRSRMNTVLAVVLAFAVLGTVASVAYTVDAMKGRDRFTAFYVLGPDGTTESLPREMVVGQQGKVILGIENHEGRDTSYTIEIWIGAKKVRDIGPMSLASADGWEGEAAFAPGTAGANQSLVFRLRKESESEVYREVRLLIDVERAP